MSDTETRETTRYERYAEAMGLGKGTGSAWAPIVQRAMDCADDELARLRGVVEAVRALAVKPHVVPMRAIEETVNAAVVWPHEIFAALASVPSSGEPTPVGQEEAASRAFGPCGGCGATWPDLHVYSNGPGGVLCVKCGWSPRKGRPDAAVPSSGETGERVDLLAALGSAVDAARRARRTAPGGNITPMRDPYRAPASPEPTGADERTHTHGCICVQCEDCSAARPVLSREAIRERLAGHWPVSHGCVCGWDTPDGPMVPVQSAWRDHLAAVLDTQEAGRG